MRDMRYRGNFKSILRACFFFFSIEITFRGDVVTAPTILTSYILFSEKTNLKIYKSSKTDTCLV